MSLRLTLATLLTVGLLAPAAFAQSPAVPGQRGQAGGRTGIDARQRMQMRRIHAGQRRGTINAAESRSLLAREARLRAIEQRLRASNGTLTVRERARLHRLLNQVNRAIARAGRR